MAKKPRNRKTKKPRKPRSHTRAKGNNYTPSHEVTRSREAKKPRNRKPKKPRKPRSHTRAEGNNCTPSHEVTRSREAKKPRKGAKKPRNRKTKKPRKPRSLKEPKAQRPRAHPDQKKKQNKYASYLKHAPLLVITAHHNVIIYLKHAPSFGDSASPDIFNTRPQSAMTVHHIS